MRFERIKIALLIAAVLCICSYLIELAIYRLGYVGTETIVDDVLIGLLGGLAAYIWASYEAERQARTREKLMMVWELTHHIGAALTMMDLSRSTKDERERVWAMEMAVERMNRVLSDLKPGSAEIPHPTVPLEHAGTHRAAE